ncbi:hypothetical protein Taro_012260 [Colocasia esculenta]|uniref:Reticulon-like protein n=1 Tax=Colocasia esculenta TaxID=4460 RepID=A0A843UCB9_COLES|nr:hypothetical protein [Colocasia esculenta]
MRRPAFSALASAFSPSPSIPLVPVFEAAARNSDRGGERRREEEGSRGKAARAASASRKEGRPALRSAPALVRMTDLLLFSFSADVLMEIWIAVLVFVLSIGVLGWGFIDVVRASATFLGADLLTLSMRLFPFLFSVLVFWSGFVDVDAFVFVVGEMSETVENHSLMDKISEKIHEYKEDSSSSDSEEEDLVPKKKRLFGRKEPVHSVLGGGKCADIILWRNKQITAGILLSGTVIWLLFEWMGYHLLTLICHSLIFALAVLFLWSNASSFVNISPPKFPEVILPEDMFLDIAQTLRHEINEAFATFRYVASGRDLKQFLLVILGLWVMSIVGSWFNFLTLFYIIFVLMYTVPVLYEKHEDHVDTVAERAMVQINKQYAVIDEKVLQKIPKAPFLGKKQH